MKQWIKKAISFLNGTPLQVKIYVMIFTVIILMSGASLLEVRISLMQTFSIQLDERVKSIGRDVAARSRDLLLTHNVYLLNELAQETVNNNSDVLYVFIQDEQGSVIVNTFGKQGVSHELLLANQVQTSDNFNLEKFMTKKGKVRDVAVSIIEGIGGTVRVGLTEKSLIHALSVITTQLLITMMIVMIFAGGISYALTKFLTSPIKQLLNMTKEVSKGNLSIRLKNYADDEIGKLTLAFNQMLSDLERSEKDKERYYQKINLRNRELSLLNELTGNVTSIDQMKMMLENFLIRLVEELNFNSGILNIKLLDKWDTFSYTRPECSCVQEIPKNLMQNACDFTNNKNRYEFTINLKDQTVGRIEICSCQELDEHSLKILNSLSNQLSVSLENMQLWHELKQKEEIRQKLLEKAIKAQEEERKRIARELHDETSQSLTSILLGLSILADKKDEQEHSNAINNLRDLIQQTLQEVHEMAWQLRPSILDKFGLTVALERYTEEYSKKYSIDVDLYMNGIKQYRMLTEMETTIYRIIQEALTNVAKYAKAKNISVIISRVDDILSVIIEDDGVGFNAEQVLKRGPTKYNLGLHGMQERASLIGGTLTIESEQGEGTTIFVKVPISKL